MHFSFKKEEKYVGAGSTAEAKPFFCQEWTSKVGFLHGRDPINDVERAGGSGVPKNNAVSTSALCNKLNNVNNNFAKK